MRTHSDNPSGQKGRRLDDLKSKTVELERELDDVRMLLKCELARGYDEIDIRDIRERIGEPDAFPSGDLYLKKFGKESEAWRPWRAYAAMYIWSGNHLL